MNVCMLESGAYRDQAAADSSTANFRYQLLPGDFSRLYRHHYRVTHGVDLSVKAEQNVHDWMSADQKKAKPHIRESVFHYSPRGSDGQRFIACIATPEMKKAAWRYCHRKQVMIDGTFGLSTSRLLLWVALGVDERNRGVPVALFLFSAPTGNRATHAGYDTKIIGEIMSIWRDWMGTQDGVLFCPLSALTDTDVKERGGLIIAWKNIILLLCKFHVRQCWTNKRSSCLGKSESYWRKYLERRFFALEAAYVIHFCQFYYFMSQLLMNTLLDCSIVSRMTPPYSSSRMKSTNVSSWPRRLMARSSAKAVWSS